jgi:hypothetical protein
MRVNAIDPDLHQATADAADRQTFMGQCSLGARVAQRQIPAQGVRDKRLPLLHGVEHFGHQLDLLPDDLGFHDLPERDPFQFGFHESACLWLG